MNAGQPEAGNERYTERTGRAWPICAPVLLAGPVLYGAGLWAASLCDGQPLGRTVCFDAAVAGHTTVVRLTIAVAMALGASLLLLATPWMLAASAIRRIPGKAATAGAWSLAVNSAALVLLFLLLRQTVGIGRFGFAAAWLAWTGVLLVLAFSPRTHRRESRMVWRRWIPAALIGLASMAALIGVFRAEQLIQCFNGDGVETFELARSLRHHFLPYWEMEWIGRFGTDVTSPSLVNSYWTFALQLLLGEGELATRATYWIWWLGIFLVSLHMAGHGAGGSNWPAAVPLALLAFLVGTWYTMYVGWNAYLADLANPGVTDAMCLLFLLLALDCLRLKDLAGWVVMMVCCSLVLYAGPVMFVLTSIAALVWQPVPRPQMLRAVLAGAAALGGLTLFYLTWGWLDGSLPGWWPTIYADYVDYYIRPIPRFGTGVLYAGYFLLGCGGISAVGLVLPFRQRPADEREPSEVGWERTVATVTLAYLAIVLCSGVKNLHYLGPLLPMPVVLWLRTGRRRGSPAASGGVTSRAAVVAFASLSLLASIYLCWPESRSVFQLNRRLGALTTFQTDSYQEACRLLPDDAVMRTLYARGRLGWYVGRHTWIHYSRLSASGAAGAARRPLLVTGRPAPSPPYRLVSKWGGRSALYCRDPELTNWLAGRRPPKAPVRFPWILQPVADTASANLPPRESSPQGRPTP